MCHGERVGSPEIPREGAKDCEDAFKLREGIIVAEAHPEERIEVIEDTLVLLEGFGMAREHPGFTEGGLEWLVGIKEGPTGFQA